MKRYITRYCGAQFAYYATPTTLCCGSTFKEKRNAFQWPPKDAKIMFSTQVECRKYSTEATEDRKERKIQHLNIKMTSVTKTLCHKQEILKNIQKDRVDGLMDLNAYKRNNCLYS
uniref:Uncharacterized protein n=1 Tax=Glossina austeni TaxID=7395 RepID=A0A1A9VQT7_GLOAU